MICPDQGVNIQKPYLNGRMVADQEVVRLDIQMEILHLMKLPDDAGEDKDSLQSGVQAFIGFFRHQHAVIDSGHLIQSAISFQQMRIRNLVPDTRVCSKNLNLFVGLHKPVKKGLLY